MALSLVHSSRPAVSALIPHIRERYPDVKVLFRSHIQIDTSLTDAADDDKTAHPAAAVWNYLWSFVREADLFVAHPVRRFVPKVVRESAMPVTYMPPSTECVSAWVLAPRLDPLLL
jgi:hypothetical protein